jgi:micrococcal nuclease
VATHRTPKACFLDLPKTGKYTFYAVISASNFSKFPSPPESLYKGKRVRLTGVVVEFKGNPEIVVSDPSQIEMK